MASAAASDLDDSINTSVFEQSSPESLRPRARSPPSIHRHESTSNVLTFDKTDDESFRGRKQCTSSRSSISSFPASVMHNIALTDNEEYGSRAPSQSQQFANGRQSPAYKHPPNSYLSAFRHPNSVRALQLESDYADSDTQSIARSPRYRHSPKSSYFGSRSPGSVHSSPTKRSSRPATPQPHRSNSRLKKEFPLVLLHCTLLSPAVTSRPQTVSEEILEAVLPEQYRKRWRTLQEKVVKNSEVKQRGVLIAHPRDDYDLLEERLLEALELERPMIRKGHYMGDNKGGDSDSGFESSSQNGSDEASDSEERNGRNQKDRCPDCGTAVSCQVEQERRFEIKVFAANGLMRSGAWLAAWEQMEKVDIEVSVWMPEEVRIEVEERLKALQAKEEAEKSVEEGMDQIRKKRTRSNTARLRHDERMREIYGDPEQPKVQAENDGLADTKEPEIPSSSPEPTGVHRTVAVPTDSTIEQSFRSHHPSQVPDQADFFLFMRHHFNVIVSDQRNLAIVLLSMLVLMFSVQNVEFGSSTLTSSQTKSTQSTSSISALDISGTLAVPQVTTTVLKMLSQTSNQPNPETDSIVGLFKQFSEQAEVPSIVSGVVSESDLYSPADISTQPNLAVNQHDPDLKPQQVTTESEVTEQLLQAGGRIPDSDNGNAEPFSHQTQSEPDLQFASFPVASEMAKCHPPAWKVLHNLQSGNAAGMCMRES